MRNLKYLNASIAILGAMLMAGCTPEARTDLGQAGSEVGQATEKSVEATGEVVQKAGEKVKDTAEATGELVGGAAKQVGAATTLTPAVKTALAADKQIDASTIDVDTKEDQKVVIIRGTQKTATQKDHATAVAKKAVADAGSSYQIRNEIKISAM